MFKEIKKQTNYDFWYEGKLIKQAKKVDIQAINAPLEQVLDICFQNQPLTYAIIEKTVVVKPKPAGDISAREVIALPPLEIKGTVTGENGSPLDGASVKLKGTDKGTVTDAQGSFTLQIPDGGTLVISYIGYQTMEVQVSKSTSLQIKLKLSESQTEEIVVVGYGTQKRRDIIGSVAEVRPDKIGGLNAAPTFDAALQGQIPGVSIQSSTGVPGAATKILIRGANSINSSTDPLWIIDGMPVSTGQLGYNTATVGQNPMSLINPNDIESIQVLKDAASTAIYGSRGSNGVILITTKSARGKMPVNNISVNAGTMQMARDFSDLGFADTKTWFSILDATYANSGRTADPIDDYFRTVPLATSKMTRAQAMNINTDWFDQAFRKGSFVEANFSSAKSFDGGNFYFSGNYRDDKGMMINNRMKRYTLRSNLEFHPLNNLVLGAKLNFSYSVNNRAQNDNAGSDNGNRDGNSGGINNLTKLSLPWLPVYDPNNNVKTYYNPYAGFNIRAYADPNNVKNELRTMRMLGGLYGEYTIPAVKGLSLRSEFSFDLMQATTTLWVNKAIRLNGAGVASSYGLEQASNIYNINYNGYATYARKFNDDHSFSIVAGAEAQRNRGYLRQASGEGLTGIYQELGRPTTMLAMNGGFLGEEYLMGLFGRANYSFKDKYLIGASFRRDGSSNFTEKNRWGNFASLGVGWVLSDEAFMSFVGSGTFLKLRASYGETGNKNVQSGLNVINYNNSYSYGAPDMLGVNGTLPRNIPSLDITWEKTNTTDIGLDYHFMNGRISGTIEYYNKFVKDMLLQGPVPSSAGVDGGYYEYYASNIWGNVGDMVNRGFEFQVRSVNVQSKNFRWTTDFNIAFNKNIIKRLTPEADATGKGMINGKFISRTGHMRNEWYIPDFAMIDPATGIEMIYVVDKDVYNETGETVRMKNARGEDSLAYATNTNLAANIFELKGRSPDPKYYGGITNTFEYRGFDFSFLVTFSGGNYIYDFNEQIASYPSTKYNLKAAILDQSWKKPGDVAKYMRLSYTNAQEIDGVLVNDFIREFEYINFDKYMYKGDFIRLKNVQLGYNFSKNLLQKLKLQGVRLYVSGTNLYTKTKFPGWDPEGAVMTTIDQVPQLKSWTVGLNVKF
ncbi:MAG: TonB-dependent receptor [Chitinophagaceae bacterium]|nr:TonB-dependent receptor [Chitinophagaceae bacterium]